jgi:hypothetical protein
MERISFVWVSGVWRFLGFFGLYLAAFLVAFLIVCIFPVIHSKYPT